MPPNPDGGFTHKTKSGMWAPGCWAVLGVLLGQRAEFRAMLLLPSTAAADLGPWGGLLRGAVCGRGQVGRPASRGTSAVSGGTWVEEMGVPPHR